jgi:hypothetical protein
MYTEFRRRNILRTFTRKTGRNNIKMELREVDGTSLESCAMEDLGVSIVASSGSVATMLILYDLSFHGNRTMKSSQAISRVNVESVFDVSETVSGSIVRGSCDVCYDRTLHLYTKARPRGPS